MREREWNRPKALRSHKTTAMTTTAFKMDLMLPAMGMKRLTNHRRTPTTIRAKRIWIRGMLDSFLRCCGDTGTGPAKRDRPLQNQMSRRETQENATGLEGLSDRTESGARLGSSSV